MYLWLPRENVYINSTLNNNITNHNKNNDNINNQSIADNIKDIEDIKIQVNLTKNNNKENEVNQILCD